MYKPDIKHEVWIVVSKNDYGTTIYTTAINYKEALYVKNPIAIRRIEWTENEQYD